MPLWSLYLQIYIYFVTFLFLVSLRELLALEGKSNLSSYFFHLILSHIGRSPVIHPLNKFSIKNFFNKCAQIRSFLRILSLENFVTEKIVSGRYHFSCSDPKFIYASNNIRIQVSKYSGLVLHKLYWCNAITCYRNYSTTKWS